MMRHKRLGGLLALLGLAGLAAVGVSPPGRAVAVTAQAAGPGHKASVFEVRHRLTVKEIPAGARQGARLVLDA
jgi:hypothetical protein